MAAGLPSENVGINEMPLLVTLAAAEKWPLFFGLSVVCENVVCAMFKRMISGIILFKNTGNIVMLHELKGLAVVFFIVLYVRDFQHTKELEAQTLL